MQGFSFDNVAINLEQEVVRVARINRKKSDMAKVYVAIWLEGGCWYDMQVIRVVLFNVVARVSPMAVNFLLLQCLV